MTIIRIDLKDCRTCPKCNKKLTKGYGYAMDYFCTLKDDRVTSGYVEWESDINPIPNWCPLKE